MIFLLMLLQAADEPVLRLTQGEWVMQAQILPDGKRLFAVSMREKGGDLACVWDLQSGKELLRLEDREKSLGRLCLSADGESIGGLMYGCKLTVWDARTGRQRMEIFPLGTLSGVALSPDGKIIVHCDPLGGPYRLYAVPSGKELRRLSSPSGRHRTPMMFSSDGRTFAGEVDRSGLGLWDATTGKHLRTIATPSTDLGSLSFSPDGSMIAAAGDGQGTTRIYRVADGGEVRLLGKDDHDVNAVRFSPDGRLLILGREDNTIRVREIASGRDLKSVPGGPRVFGISPDGRTLVTSGKDTLAVWPLLPSSPRPEEFARLWEALGDQDAAAAHAAVGALSGGGEAAIADLRKRLLDRPLDAAAIGARVDDLSRDDVAVREKAADVLEESAHDPAVWAALEKGTSAEEKARLQAMIERQAGLHVASPVTLRRIRAVWALELLGARAAIEELASGPAHARQTLEAKKALLRLPR